MVMKESIPMNNPKKERYMVPIVETFVARNSLRDFKESNPFSDRNFLDLALFEKLKLQRPILIRAAIRLIETLPCMSLLLRLHFEE